MHSDKPNITRVVNILILLVLNIIEVSLLKFVVHILSSVVYTFHTIDTSLLFI